MISFMKDKLRRFCKAQDGSALTLEFMILMPILVYSFLFGIELSIYSIRQMQLDRGLEVTTREVRLNTGVTFTHDDLKDLVCLNAGGISDCEENLVLEMAPVVMREFRGLPEFTDCVDQGAEVNPQRGWSVGQQHEVMLMRACYRFKPGFSGIGLGLSLMKDADGNAMMASMSTFVQEPQ